MRRNGEVMTLGKKLANYRRVSNLTQQQIGDMLNLSAQAISKWENDLAQPDLASLKALSKLYHVTLDELLDLEAPIHIEANEPEAEAAEAEESERGGLIGFCKNCGIAVDASNVGESEPIVKCKKCVDAEEREQQRREREREQAIKAAELKAQQDVANRKYKVKNRLAWALSVAGAIFVAITAFLIVSVAEESPDLIPAAIVIGYMAFSFTALMFFEGVVSDVFLGMLGKSIQLPGLIFTFDLDGLIWLIGMKILFWLIGIAVTVGAALLGFALAFVMAPFVFPFKMVSVAHAIKVGDDSDLII